MNGTSKCGHIGHCVDLDRIKAAVNKDGLAKDCSWCKNVNKEQEKEGGTKSIPGDVEQLWLCLRCGNQACDRNEHAHLCNYVMDQSPHPIRLGTKTWKVWCYICQAFVDTTLNKEIQETVDFLGLWSTWNQFLEEIAPSDSSELPSETRVFNNFTIFDMPLIRAAASGDLAAVKKSLKSGANINYIQYYKLGGKTYKVTAMGASAYNGHIEIVQYLVEAGANPYIVYDGWTPRSLARKNGNHSDITKYLKTIMMLPKWRNQIDEKSGFTPLTYAIFNQKHKMIQNSISLGADVCRVDGHGKTPLLYAIEKNLPEVVEKLLEKGAIASGVSALQRAIELRRNNIAKLLINDKGLKIGGFFEDGYTPLTKCIALVNTEITNCLIQKGADLSKVDANNSTPIDKALEINCLEIIEALVTNGAKIPRTIAKRGFNRLAEDGAVETYEFLIRKGWDVHQVDENGKTALALSTANGFLSLSMLLVERGADIDLAKSEVEAFRKKNIDFDGFLQEMVTKKKERDEETGQE